MLYQETIYPFYISLLMNKNKYLEAFEKNGQIEETIKVVTSWLIVMETLVYKQATPSLLISMAMIISCHKV